MAPESIDARIYSGYFHQRAQAGLAGARERAQPFAHEATVLVDQRDDVGDRGERHQVEVLVGERRVLPRALQQRLRELVGDRGGAQLRARVAAEPGVHDRGVRQRAVGARGVVVGDHDVEPRGARGGDLLDRRDRAVDRDQQVGPAGSELLDGRGGEPVAVVDPAREVPVDLRAERAQCPHEDGGRGHAVDVVVAMHRDPRLPRDVPEDVLRGGAQAAERVERMAVGAGEELLGRRRVREPSPDQDLGEHVGHAERAAQPFGGGVVIRRDREARVDPSRHGRRSVSLGADRTSTVAGWRT